jgi:hypothetical protein
VQITTDLDSTAAARLDRAVVRQREAGGHRQRVSRSSWVREAILQRLERDEAAAGNGEGADSRRPRSTSSSPVGEGVPRSPVGGAGGPPRATPARRRRGAVKS